MKRNFRLWFFWRFWQFLRPWIWWAYLFLVTSTKSVLYFPSKRLLDRVWPKLCVTSLVSRSQQRWHPQAVGVWAWLFIWHFTMFKRSIKLQRLLNTLYLFAYKNTTLTSNVTFAPRLQMPFFFKCSLSEWKKRYL